MFDAVTYGAAVGAAKRYTDEHSGSDDAVKYTEQSLTSEQQAQARENIGAAASDDIPTDAVKYTAQTLTDAQKTQARTNIGAGTSNFNGDYNALRNAPPIAKSSGENAAAGGYYSTASGQYGFAFGYRVVTTHAGEVAFGKHNESSEDTAFAIGDGRDIQYRHNLMELKTDGTLLLNGNAVKTEDATDNKLRLGQIWALKVVSSSDCRVQPKNGFYNLFGSISSINFSFAEGGSIATSVILYQFGDFIGFLHPSLSNTVQVQLIDGRLKGHPVTGQWIKVENCYMMFYGCGNLTSLNLSMFDTSEVKNMGSMFSGCTNLATLDISSFDMSNVVGYDYMFGSSSSNRPPLTTLKAPRINPYNNIPLNKTLYSQDGTAYTNLPVTTGTSIELRQSWT